MSRAKSKNKTHEIRAAGLDVRVPQIGQNDLCDPAFTLEIMCNGIRSLVNSIMFEHQLRRAIICQLLPRRKIPSRVPDYNVRESGFLKYLRGLRGGGNANFERNLKIAIGGDYYSFICQTICG